MLFWTPATGDKKKFSFDSPVAGVQKSIGKAPYDPRAAADRPTPSGTGGGLDKAGELLYQQRLAHV